MAIEKILTHKNGVAEYIITSKEDLNGLVDVEVGSRARLLSPVEVRDYIYCGKWAEVKREDSYDDNEIWGIIDDISGEIRDNAVESVNEYHKNLDGLVDCTVTEFEGRDITINPSIEGKTRNVVVKGETYQNLVTNIESSYTLTQGTITDRSKLICETSLIKPNTLYTVIFEVTDINLAGTDEISICVQYSYCSITSKTLASVKNKGIYMGTFTTGNIVEDSNRKFRIKGLLEQWENDTTTTEKTITFKNVVVLEGDYTNSYIPPYFEGIVGVGDKSKNLFNPKEAILGYVDSTGGFVEVVNNIRTNYLLIKPNTPYIGMSQGASKLNNYSWFDKNKTFIKRDSMEGYAISPNNAMYLIYHNQYCAIGFTVDLSSVKIQLEEGTVSTPYEPYYDGHKTEILSRGKNLFKAIKSGRQIHNTSEVNIINSNSVEIVSASNTWASECFILNCKPNTKYYFSCNAKKVSNEGGIYVRVYDKKTHTVIKELVNRGAFEKDTYFNKSFTTPSDLTNCYVGVQLYCSKEGGSDTNGGKWIYDNIILEEENSTSYIPYQEDKIQILLDEPLMKLPNGVCDTLEQRDDGVYLVKRVGKVVLNGSENWSLTNTMTTNKVYSYYNEDVKRGTANITSIICDNLPSTNRNNIINNDVTGIASRSSNKGFMISIPITEASNSANFKTWLSSNNLTVYYELATPIETKLDISTTNVTTFKDVTHISTTNEIQPIINVTLETTNISKDANQYFNIENDKNFLLPNMDDIENNSIKELNLYMDVKGEYTLTFPSDIKWASNVINLNKADYMSILLKYIKVNDVGLWLGNIRGIKNNYNLVTRYTYFGDDVLPEMPSDYEYTIEYVVNDDGSKTRAIRSVDGTLPSTCSFSGMTTVTDVDYYNVGSNCTTLYNVFGGCTSLTSITFADNIDTSNVTAMDRMFYKCESLKTIDVSKINTSSSTDLSSMFDSCQNLIILNLSNFDTSKVTNMSYMFNNCSSLTSLDLSNFNTSKVINMSNMFRRCKLLTSLDLSNFNTSKVSSMASMFRDTNGLSTLNISKFNTDSVTNMSYMFYNCESLESLDLSNFNTSNVENMISMFNLCKSLTSLDLSNFNTNKITSMYKMFRACESLTFLDLSSFDTSNVTDTTEVFYSIPTTTIIKVSSTFTKTESDCGWNGTFTIAS